jgi:alpha-galactosidase
LRFGRPLPLRAPPGKPQIQGGNLRIEFDNHLRSRVVARFDKTETVMGPFSASETVTTADKPWTGFLRTSQKLERTKDIFGEDERLTVEGKSGALTKMVTVTVYDDFPAMAFFEVQYTNAGTTKLAIKSWSNNGYTVSAQRGVGAPAFWSYQSGSYEKRPNWVVPLHTNFQQENYQGMNASDYGGGTPIVDVWRRDVGMAWDTSSRGRSWFPFPYPWLIPRTPRLLCAVPKLSLSAPAKVFLRFARSSPSTRETTSARSRITGAS